MKKIVLLLSLCFLVTIGNAQVIFYVEEPSPNEGNYDFTYASGATWGVSDLTDPANSVTGEMVLIDDGTGEDNPEGCVDVVNDLTGKIAVLYRGSCEFGRKALNAQEAGAIGVIIINNLAGVPVAMGAGADGGAVTIPVVMITNTTGALLRDEIDAGTSTVFIGSKNGLYPYDIGFTAADHLRAQRFGNIQALSQGDSEFEVEVGTWARNYGSEDQTNVQLNVKITLEGDELYNETSEGVDILSGDSAWIPLDAFSQASYANGYYHVDYTLFSGEEDESGYDNTGTADFNMSDDIFSVSRLDPETTIPVNTTNQFNGTTGVLYTCLFFQDPNASRVGVVGVNYSAGTSQNPVPTSLDGETIEFYVYEWNNEWTDANDIEDQSYFDDMDDIADVEYVYIENAQSENIYIELEEAIRLEDNQRYLFCMQHYSNTIYPGYDTKIDYYTNLDQYSMPVAPIYSTNSGGDQQWFLAGFGTDLNPAMSIKMATDASLVELPATVDLAAYPNPANHTIHIPLEMKDGNIVMTIVDVDGKIVDVQNVTMTEPRLDVDVTALAAGLYVINLEFADGQTGSINVAVTK